MHRHLSAVACVLCLAAPAALAAPAQAPAAPTVNPPYPVRDMTMANVREIFGPPQRMLAPTPATGAPPKPPITRWIYPDFEVYFERNRVIHTVRTNPRQAPTPRTHR